MKRDNVVWNGDGFTLMEVLVAMVVASLLLTIIMPAAMVASTRRHHAQDRLAAVDLASNILAERALPTSSSNEKEGKVHGLGWVFRETPIMSDPRGFFTLNRLEVQIKDREGRALYTLSTRKLRAVQSQ